jgi:hypothetical protein
MKRIITFEQVVSRGKAARLELRRLGGLGEHQRRFELETSYGTAAKLCGLADQAQIEHDPGSSREQLIDLLMEESRLVFENLS